MNWKSGKYSKLKANCNIIHLPWSKVLLIIYRILRNALVVSGTTINAKRKLIIHRSLLVPISLTSVTGRDVWTSCSNWWQFSLSKNQKKLNSNSDENEPVENSSVYLTLIKITRFKSIILSPLKHCGRCAFAIISGKFLCTSTGNLYHGNS